MLKVALLEEETVAKEIIFELGKIFQGTESVSYTHLLLI